MIEIDTIRAPWTAEQVVQLNQYQKLGLVDPFTCGNENCVNQAILVAYHHGWECPSCQNYQHTWAHAFMADPVVITAYRDLQKKMSETTLWTFDTNDGNALVAPVDSGQETVDATA